MKITQRGAFITDLQGAEVQGSTVSFKDQDLFDVFIDKDVILRLASIIKYDEQQRLKRSLKNC